MKKIFLCFVFLPISLFSQKLSNESKKWLNESLNDSTVEPKELKQEFIKYNFSNLWITKQQITIGFIGNNFQRFYMHFHEIKKNNVDPFSYFIKGSSRVKNNICSFDGELKIINIREIKKQKRVEMLKIAKQENDTELLRRFEPIRFIVLLEYTFKEDINQKDAGIFKGVMKSNFYIKGNTIFYNDLDYGDSYSNNSCVGFWQSYKTGSIMNCNWGDYRIPYCGDLDGGASEFYPSDKYLKNGWLNYRNAYFNDDQQAIKDENKKWWETK